MSRPVAPSDQMRAAGSGRRKVALPPGRSQLDWVRKQLKISPSRPRTISIAELRRHSSRHDAWLAVDSHVYDVTSYVEYHPGGIDMLLAGVGKDATKLFNKYHAWVNAVFMLKNCFLGILDASGEESEDTDDDSSSEEKNDSDNDFHSTNQQVTSQRTGSKGNATSTTTKKPEKPSEN